MLFLKIKDLNFRKKFKNNELKLKIFKYVKINLLTNLNWSQKKEKIKNILLIKTLIKNFSSKKFALKSKVKIIKRCILTNKPRSIIKPFNLSRNAFHGLVHSGIIPGYKKAIW